MKVGYYNFIWLTILLALAGTLAACSNPNLDFIQGQWERGNVHYYDSWIFDGGEFLHQTGIDMINPRIETGSYALLESQGNELVLELYNLQDTYSTYSENRREIKIVISRETGEAKIGRGMYTRAVP